MHSVHFYNQTNARRSSKCAMKKSSMNTLMLNADLSQRCVVDGNALPWQPSPSPLVHRRLLERNGGEVARATSIVRYDAGAKFNSHNHALGEEILVLDGTLSDELGDYGPGTYLKNPSGSSHATTLRGLSDDEYTRSWTRGVPS